MYTNCNTPEKNTHLYYKFEILAEKKSNLKKLEYNFKNEKSQITLL